MTTIRLQTKINAPVEKCFDLSRSIELHLRSTSRTGERVVAGRKTGLVELGDTVTWEAVHFGIRQKLTSRITEMQATVYFCDEMQRGAFKSMRHEHRFAAEGAGTVMTDIFSYETPFGVFEKIFDIIILERYMRRFLEERNALIKSEAETIA